MHTLDKYTYDILSCYDSTWDDEKKGLALVDDGNGGYVLKYDWDLSKITNGAKSIKLKLIGKTVGSFETNDYVSERTLVPIYSGSLDSEYIYGIDYSSIDGIVTINVPEGTVCPYIDRTFIVNYTDTYAVDGSAIPLQLLLNFKENPMSERYKILYKIGEESYKDAGEILFKPTNGYPHFYAYTQENNSDIWLLHSNIGSLLEICLTKINIQIPYIENGTTKYFIPFENSVEPIIDTIEIPGHTFRWCKLITINETPVLASCKIFLDYEESKLHYYINKVDLKDTADLSEQYGLVDILITDGETSVVNTNNQYKTIGNTIAYRENVYIDKNGYFYNSSMKKMSIDLLGLENSYNYIIYIYDHAKKGIFTARGVVPRTLKIGQNVIKNKVYYPELPVEITTSSSLLAGSYPEDVDVFFPLDKNLKGVIGTDRDFITYPESVNLPFDQFVTNEYNEESYNALLFGSDVNLYYAKFPNTYTNSTYDDHGFATNIWPNNLFGYYDPKLLLYNSSSSEPVKNSQDRYIDKYGNVVEYSNGTVKMFFCKFFIREESDQVPVLSVKLGMLLYVFLINLSTKLFLILYSNDTENEIKKSIDISAWNIEKNKWYTFYMLFRIGNPTTYELYDFLTTVLLYIGLTTIDNYNDASLAQSNDLKNVWIGCDNYDVGLFCMSSVNHLNFQDYIDDYALYIGNILLDAGKSFYSICKVGWYITNWEIGNNSFNNAINSDVLSKVGGSGSQYPWITIKSSDYNKILTKDDCIEYKDRKIMFYVPSDIPKGSGSIKVGTNEEQLYYKDILIDHVRPDDESIDFDLDFNAIPKNEDWYKTASAQLASLFWAKLETRGGNLCGGENINNIYLHQGNIGEKDGCVVLEAHGDFYKGTIPNVEKNTISKYTNLYYGGPAPLITDYKLDSDGNVLFYTDDPEVLPDPLKLKVNRVGALIQSKKYYGYGTWEIEFKLEKDSLGPAWCWWLFHYKEIYATTNKDAFMQYIGNHDTDSQIVDINNDPRAFTYIGKNVFNLELQENGIYKSVFNFDDVTRRRLDKWNYLHAFQYESGVPFLCINNEIDMELGSEIESVIAPTDPHNANIKFYIPALSNRTTVIVTSGKDTGMWMIDFTDLKTISALDEAWNILNTADSTYFNRYDSSLSISSNNLAWVKVSDMSYQDHSSEHNTMTCRFNNWRGTNANTGNTYKGKISSTKLYSAYKAYEYNINGETGDRDEYTFDRTGWTMNNDLEGNTLSLHTPLGSVIRESNADNPFYGKPISYLPKRMDDDKWHTWKLVYTRDYTLLWIDDELYATNCGAVPYIPMAMVIGPWFPSYNSWLLDTTDGYFGGWASDKGAPWDVRHMYVRRVAFKHFTELEVPRDALMYPGEDNPWAGLREICPIL